MSERFPEAPAKVVDLNTRLPFQGRGPHNTGEPPGGDQMEARVRQIESDMSFIKGKLEDMPTKDWMNTRLLLYVGTAVALIGLMLRFIPPAG